MVYDKVNPYDLDWGPATAEGFDEKAQEILLVFNVDVSSIANIEHAIVFVVGRVIWFDLQIAGIAQRLVFDFRGQPLALLNRARKMKENVLEKVALFNKAIHVNIEILI